MARAVCNIFQEGIRKMKRTLRNNIEFRLSIMEITKTLPIQIGPLSFHTTILSLTMFPQERTFPVPGGPTNRSARPASCCECTKSVTTPSASRAAVCPTKPLVLSLFTRASPCEFNPKPEMCVCAEILLPLEVPSIVDETMSIFILSVLIDVGVV